jgi:hypothetical protein
MPVQVFDAHENMIAGFVDISTLSALAEEIRWLRHAPTLKS